MLCLMWLGQETGHNGGVLRDWPDDGALPQLIPLQPRLSLATITDTVAAHFGQDASRWQPRRRVDDARRAVAAHLARRRFGYRAGEVAEAPGYRSASSVMRATARVESGNQRLQQGVAELDRKLH